MWTSSIMVTDGKNFPASRSIYCTVGRHMPQDSKLNIHRFENWKSCK